MSTPAELKEISEALRQARITRTPIRPPVETWPALTEDGAFEVQKLTVETAIKKDGDRLVGYKLGNIAKVMQDAFGVDHPDYGFLLGSLFHLEGTKVNLDNFIAPFVELEPAFVLKADLKAPVTVADVINAINYAVPAIEIIDSRVQNWAIGLYDTLADNGSTGAVILGGQPRKVTDLDLSNIDGVLYHNGEKIITGNTRNILGNPLNALTWLVNRLGEFGVEFKAGQVVLPGSCLQAMPMKPGKWVCTYEGWGTIEFDVIQKSSKL